MDKKDKKILEQLKQNSRATIRGIAKRTGIRPSTVHNRMKKLEENVIQRYTVKTDNSAVGEDFIVFMLVKTEGTLPNSVFKDRHIKDVFGITGSHDLLMKLKFADIQGFNRFIHDFREIDGVKDTLTYVATVTIREEI